MTDVNGDTVQVREAGVCVCGRGRGKKLTRNFATYLSYMINIIKLLLNGVRNEECSLKSLGMLAGLACSRL